MSFFRPEARRLVLRWTETAIYAAALTLGLWWLWTSVSAPAWRWGLMAGVAALGLWFLRAAIIQALTASDGDGPGVVLIDERRITYLGPHNGGIAALDEIETIEILAPDPAAWRYEPEWALRWSVEEPAVVIPASAEGADRLVTAFAALPGFSPGRALAALRGEEGARITIWRRGEVPSAPALATPGGGD